MASTTESESTPVMHLAELLSDLVSLRVCDPAAALALVSVRADSASSSAPAEAEAGVGVDADVDLGRAKDLVELHYAVKESHRRGELAQGLMEARAMVERAVGG